MFSLGEQINDLNINAIICIALSLALVSILLSLFAVVIRWLRDQIVEAEVSKRP